MRRRVTTTALLAVALAMLAPAARGDEPGPAAVGAAPATVEEAPPAPPAPPLWPPAPPPPVVTPPPEVAADATAHPSRGMQLGDLSVEAGQQVSVLLHGTVTRNLSYASFLGSPVLARNDETGSTWELRLGARAFYDFALSDSEIAIRDLAILRRTEHFTATVGFQQIPWGETLAFPVADIVNPRDWRDPLFLDVDFVRLPVLAANVELTTGPFRAQAIVTPFPRAPLFPESGSPFLPAGPPLLPAPSFPVDHAGSDAEGGGRVGYIVGGWDLSAFFFSHWNRMPVYELTAGDAALVPVLHRVNSVGASVTKPFGDHVVVRADSVLSLDELRQSPVFAAPATVTESQNVVEGDLTFDGDWLFSVQYEYDRQGDLDRHWMSGRAQKGLFDHRLDLAVFGWKGVNNGDSWIQPSVVWRFLEVLSAEVRADFVWGTEGDAGLLGYLNGKHRVLGIVRVRL